MSDENNGTSQPDFAPAELPLGVRAGDLAAMLGLTARRVQQLAADGVITKPLHGVYPVPRCVREYCDSLRRQAASRRGERELTNERTNLLELRIVRLRRDEKAAEAELIPRRDVEAAVRHVFDHCRRRLLAIADVADDLAGRAASEVRERLTVRVHQACHELAQTTVQSKQAKAVRQKSEGIHD